jgi:folate-binding protein YgfZ
MPAPSLPQIQADYQILREGAGFVNLGSRTQIELTGKDRLTFLQGFCTNDVKQLQPGNGCEAFLTNLQGKTLSFVLVYCYNDSLVLETVADQTETIANHLDRYIIQEDVILHDRTPTWQQWLIAGARTAELLAQETTTPLPEQELQHVDTQLQSIPVSIRNVPWSRHPCYAINSQQEQASAVEQILTSTGFQNCLAEAADINRIEAGFPLYQQDITDSNLPQEIDRNDRAISFTKGCYLGQETVARIDALGHVNKKLCGLKFNSQELPAIGSELSVDGKAVARVTSCCHSPDGNSVIALAYVQRGHDEPGKVLAGDTGTATVCPLPFD